VKRKAVGSSEGTRSLSSFSRDPGSEAARSVYQVARPREISSPLSRPPEADSPNGAPLSRPAGSSAQDRSRWWRDRLRRRLLASADCVVSTAIGVVVASASGVALAWAALAIPLGLISAKLLGLYDKDHRAIRHLTVDEVPSIAAWAGITVVATSLLVTGDLARNVFIQAFALAVVGSVVLRTAARWLWRQVTPAERTVVIGDGEPAHAIRRKVALFDDMHLQLVPGGQAIADGTANGNGHAAERIDGVDRVVIAWHEADPQLVERMLIMCRRSQAKLSVVSPYTGLARPASQLSQIADLPVLEYRTWDVPRSTMLLKRAFDVVASGLALVALVPAFILIAGAIKLDDRNGPVIFRQRRAGRGGKPFTMFKFRSMTVDAEERLAELVQLDDLGDPMFKIRNDPRVTRVGHVLRRYSLDELPQLINVLRGEMSLVGPRPEEVPVVERYAARHRFRLEAAPGLTGPMQVFGRGELTFSERLAVEQDYLENMSVFRDLRLIALTLPAVVRGRGAF